LHSCATALATAFGYSYGAGSDNEKSVEAIAQGIADSLDIDKVAATQIDAAPAADFIAVAVGQTRRVYSASVAVAGTDTTMTSVGCGAMTAGGSAGFSSQGSPQQAAIEASPAAGGTYTLRSPNLTNMGRLPRAQLAILEATTAQFNGVAEWHGLSSAAMNALTVQAGSQASAIVLAAFARKDTTGHYFLLTGDGSNVTGIDTGISRNAGDDVVFLLDCRTAGTVVGSLYVNGALAYTGSKTTNVSSGTTALAIEFSAKNSGVFSVDGALVKHWAMDTK
jgi:hypothetical protein